MQLIFCCIFIDIFCFAVHAQAAPAISQHKIMVSTTIELIVAINKANKNGHTEIILQNGRYQLSSTIQILKPYISLVSVDKKPSNTQIVGIGMRNTKSTDNIIRVAAPYFTLDGITLEQSPNHIIQIAGESNADFPVLRNCILKDSYEQLLKVSYNRQSKVSSDNGVIQNCEFSYSAGIGPQYYIGGIDVHGGKDWVVRDSLFKGIASPDLRVAEHAIHFWNNTGNTLIENNIIINSDRGIGFGMKNRPALGGVIQNNVILHYALDHPNADVGIVLEESPNTKVLNNKVFLAHNYHNAIEYRFSSTINVEISGNLTNKAIRKRDSASATLTSNQRSQNIEDFLTEQQLTSLWFKAN